MKRMIAILLCAAFAFGLCACGGKEENPWEYLTTVTKGDGPVVTTEYTFCEGKVYAVGQKIEYKDQKTLESEYATILDAPDYFTDLKKADLTVSYKMTEKCINEYLSGADRESLIAEAKENGLEIITD